MKITVKQGRILANRKIYCEGETVEVVDAVAEELIARGLTYTTETEAAEGKEKALDEMTVKELVAYVKENDLDVNTRGVKKDDLLDAIRVAEEADQTDDHPEGEEQNNAEDNQQGPITGMPEE